MHNFKEKLRQYFDNVKLVLLAIIVILGVISAPIPFLLFLSEDGWNVLNVFILCVVVLFLFAK